MDDALAILLAGGRGARMAGAFRDKVLAVLGDRPVFAHSLEAFVEAGVVGRFVVVYRDAPQRAALARLHARGAAREWPVTWVRGGAERRDSVANALAVVPAAVRHVYIHDCARPLVAVESLRAVAAALRADGAAVLAHRVTDTIKRLPPGPDTPRRRRPRTLARDRLWAMETPQAFRRDWIVAAYAAVRRRGLAITDDAAALEAATRHRLTLVENPLPNPKITRPADLEYAAFLLARRAARNA